MASSDEQSNSTTPEVPSVSPGSSVSTTLKEEYEDLLKYAIVTPVLEPSMGGRATLRRPDPSMPGASVIGSFTLPNSTLQTKLDVTEVVKVPSSVEGDHTTQLPHSTPRPHEQYPQSDTSTSEHHQEDDEHDLESVPQRVPPTASAPTIHSLAVSHTHNTQGEEEGRDQELVQLEMQLETWCGDMKRNILAEFAQCLLRLKQRMKGDLEGEKAKYAHAMNQAHREVERMTDLAATYERSIANKDQIIANLTGALQRQRSKSDLQSTFGRWKVHHIDVKREHFVTKMAAKHHTRRLLLRVWCAWHGIIESRWKQHVEKACQSRAEEVCMQLTNEYEERLAVMQKSLDEARVDVQQMKAERDLFAENMKKAFMRGVCALNLEAMTMFHSGSGRNEGGGITSREAEGHSSDSNSTDCGPGTGNPPYHVPCSDHGHNVSNDSRHPVSIGVSFNAEEACLRADHRPRITKPAAMTRSSLHAAEPASQRQVKVPCKQGGAGRKPATAKTAPAVVIERHPQS